MENLNIKNLKKEDWQSFRFDAIAFNISERVEPRQTSLDRYVGLEHLDSDTIHIKRWGVPTDVEGTKLKVYHGDIIFGKRRAYQRKAAICEFDAICSAHAMVLRANPAVIEPALFPFFLHSDTFMHRAIDISVGSLSPTINWKTLASQEFLLPPKPQQARLAELLWAGDEVVQRYASLVNSIQTTIQSAYKIFFDQAEVISTPLGIVSEIVMGQSPDGSTYNFTGVGVPLINGPTEFTERYPVKIQWTSSPTKTCRPGDVLLCVRGSTTGRMNIADDVYCIGRGIAAIRGGKSCLTGFLEYALTHFIGEIKRLAVGSTFPNIDSKSLKSIAIPQYPIDEQKKIVSKLNSLTDAKNHVLAQVGNLNIFQTHLINHIFTA